MIMKVKRIVTLLLAAFLVTPALTGSKVKADSSDSYYQFDFTLSDSSEKRTWGRSKDNYTSVYVKVNAWVNTTSDLGLVYMKGYGASDIYGSNLTLRTYKTYYVGKGYTGESTMVNYIKENGHSHAVLGGYPNNGYGTVMGVWSPDTSGTVAEMTHF